MRKFTLYTSMAALVALSAVSADAAPVRDMLRIKTRTSHAETLELPRLHKSADAKKNVRGLRRTAEATKYQAGVIRSYVTDFMGGWEDDAVYTQNFDSKGRLSDVSENYPGEDEVVRTSYQYDEYGKVLEELVQRSATGDAADFVNETRTVRTYDPRIHSLVIGRNDYKWDGSEWAMYGYNYYREVTRNNDGNVEEIMYYSLYQDEYEPVQKVTVTYGEDGKASTITEYQLSYVDGSVTETYWKEGYSFRDCTWYQTDGQIAGTDYVFEGANKIRSYSEYSEGEPVGDVTVEYDGDTDNFVTTMEGEGYVMGQTWVDLPNSGYYSDLRLEMDFGDGEMYEQHSISTEQFNDYGLQTAAVEVDYYGDAADVYSWITGVQEYNGDGAAVSLVLSLFEPAEEEEEYSRRRVPAADTDWSQVTPPVPGETYEMMKYEFDDLVKVPVTGIASVAEDANAPVEYYTIDGVRVSEPASGLYIRRQGAQVGKILVK